MSRKQVCARARKAIGPTVAHKALKALGEEKMGRIDEMLLEGTPCALIAKSIQEDWGEMLDTQQASIKKMLERYRGTELRDRTLARIAGAQGKAEVSVINTRLNALDEMDMMVRIQKDRVTRILSREADLPKGILLKDASNEMRLMKEMLFDLGKIQLETGVLHRAPKTVKGSMTDPTGQVQQFEWTEEQEDLMAVLERAEQRALTHG
jgi:hypothetical protein